MIYIDNQIMFLDISFLGAASYRKEGYARIYSKLKKERRRKSVCLDEQFYCSAYNKYDSHHLYEKSQAKLDVTLRYYVNSQELSREAKKRSQNKLNESFKIQRHNEKHYARRYAAAFSKVSELFGS